MIFEQKSTIQSLLCDRTDHLTLWGLARLFQEVAEAHTVATHIGYEHLIQQNKIWVLARMLYQVNEMPVMGENVILKTWSRGCDGLQCLRDFQLLDGSGKVLAGATAVWVVIDYETRRLCRLNDLMQNYEHHSQQATDSDKLARIKIPEAEPSYRQEIPVVESMIDHNRHVNNAEYLKIMFDHLTESQMGESVPHRYHIQMEYLMETAPMDTLTLERYTQAATTWVRIRNSKGLSFVAELTL